MEKLSAFYYILLNIVANYSMTNFADLSTVIVILNERKYRKAREFVKIAPGARDDHDPPSRERK